MDLRQNTRSQLAVAFGLLVFVAVVYGGAAWLTHRMPSAHPAISPPVANATPGASVTPIPANVPVVPMPTLDPQPFPTPVIDGPVTTSAPPVLWKVTELNDPKFHVGYWMAPSQVVAQVRQDYADIDAYHRTHIFDSNPQDLKRFYVEPLLDIVMRSEQEDEQKGEARGDAKLVRPQLQILGFSADGSQVQVAEEMHGETIPIYNRSTHQLIRVEHLPVGVAISTLVYDPADRRWKVSDSRFVPGPPGAN